MDIGKALGFPFEDEDWLMKLLVAFVVSLVPIVQFALPGWQYRLAQNTMRGEERPLPAWDDFGDRFMKGLLLAVAWLLYQLPSAIFYCVGAIVFFGFGAALGVSDNGDMSPVLWVVLSCCGCLSILYSILAGIVFAGGYIRFLDTETFNTFMEVRDNFALVRNNLGQFLLAALYILIGSIIPIVNLYAPGHLIGQLAKELPMGGEPAPAAA